MHVELFIALGDILVYFLPYGKIVFVFLLLESNRHLKELTLEDINLSDCHCAIFQLLDNYCMLEGKE